MKEFIDKLIERLKKLPHAEEDMWIWLIDAELTIRELAEEYKDCILVHTQGLDVGIQCAMCTNPMKSDRGCDGGCLVNKEMYKKVLDVIERHTQIAPYTEGE